jgi:hypothetical protein
LCYDDTVGKALTHNIINTENIEYLINTSYALPQHHFKQFLCDVYDKLDPTYTNGGKFTIHGFIGMLGKSHSNTTHHYFEHNYDVAAHELINHENNCEREGIYPQGHNEVEKIHISTFNDEELERAINTAADNTSEPIL